MSLIFDTIVVSDKFILVSAQIEIYNISTRNSLYGFTCICICKKKNEAINITYLKSTKIYAFV